MEQTRPYYTCDDADSAHRYAHAQEKINIAGHATGNGSAQSILQSSPADQDAGKRQKCCVYICSLFIPHSKPTKPGGERDPQKLAAFRDPRIQTSEEEIAKSLEGNWRPERVFVLRQEVEMYDAYQRRIAECDQQLQKHLASFADTELPQSPKAESKEKRAKSTKNAPRFDLGSELKRITGVDLTRIDGIDVMVAQTLLSEVGMDMSRWNTEAHFSSWLGLCPDNRMSGDKLLGKGTRHVVNRAATALRLAARNLIRSRSLTEPLCVSRRPPLDSRAASADRVTRLLRFLLRKLVTKFRAGLGRTQQGCRPWSPVCIPSVDCRFDRGPQPR
jgi:Transposase IS116/IS110/IS902 family